MESYDTYIDKNSLINAYASMLTHTDKIDTDTAKIMAKDSVKYVPHIYRGGWVIVGFGYSTERIGSYITLKKAGHPNLVQ